MLCELCWFMLRGQERMQWKGSFDLHFRHHETVGSLRSAAASGCKICRILRDQFPNSLAEEWYRNRDQAISITAQLSIQHIEIPESRDPRHDSVYRLDFNIRCGAFNGRRTFVLKNIHDTTLDLKYRTETSDNTSSAEVFELASQWIQRCKCVTSPVPPQYPKRLLTWLNKDGRNDENDEVVRLVETKDWRNGRPEGTKVQYVTLSHCWGKPSQVVYESENMLSPALLETFKQGIPVDRLRRTFREAIRFARSLDHVGYIWIDSLCILQGPENVDDWLTQSAEMDRVYGYSYLNLSATAAASDDDGLFFQRQHRLLWEDEINLDIANIPGSPLPSTDSSEEVSMPDIRRCLLLDALFWDELVEDAPVNKRGWVLQERLMTPRVLHFCKDQIAWECHEFEAAESYPTGLSMYRLRADDIIDRSRMRDLTEDQGILLRRSRLRCPTIDPDIHLKPVTYNFELWKHIVEVYSRAELTRPQDKLVALSGIVREMATKIGTKDKPAKYVAGLWRPYLASQLLWKVEVQYDDHSGLFWHRSTRPSGAIYRAPSFSWASIDAHLGCGVVYGEVTDQDIFIRVKRCDVMPKSADQPYGLVAEGGGVEIEGRLRAITLSLFPGSDKKPTPTEASADCDEHSCPGHVGWQLRGRCGSSQLNEKLVAEKHANVYLDCLSQDKGLILNSRRTYCLPAARGDRIHCEDYLICLLLLAVDGEVDEINGRKHGPYPRGTFRRIGLTKLSSWGDKATYNHISGTCDEDKELPCLHYDEVTGKHTIRII